MGIRLNKNPPTICRNSRPQQMHLFFLNPANMVFINYLWWVKRFFDGAKIAAQYVTMCHIEIFFLKIGVFLEGEEVGDGAVEDGVGAGGYFLWGHVDGEAFCGIDAEFGGVALGVENGAG